MTTDFDVIRQAVESHRQLILDTLAFVTAHPETGYREMETSRYMEQVFRELSYDVIPAGDIPGFYTVLDTGRPGPEVLVLGELDAVLCANHPEANPETGAVHSCGHNAQCAALVGIAAALKEAAVAGQLCGRVRLCAVPAEELLEMDYRCELREKGVIRYFGGKPEFLYRGYFDGVDMALMVHTTPDPGFKVNIGAIGCQAKRIVYKGRAAHAGGSPWNGVNALYAATQGLSAINAIRETFKESDIIRVHPILTSGGSAVNVIPDQVHLESYVRGSSYEAISEANRKVNRALCGAALSIGANVDIVDIPGYSPYTNCPAMIDVAAEALAAVYPDQPFQRNNFRSSGSTDMGNLACVMPVVHPYAPGAVGLGHGANYYIENPEAACVQSAAWQTAMLRILLGDGGQRALKILATHKPPFAGKEAYFAYLDGLDASGDRITYHPDGTVSVDLTH